MSEAAHQYIAFERQSAITFTHTRIRVGLSMPIIYRHDTPIMIIK